VVEKVVPELFMSKTSKGFSVFLSFRVLELKSERNTIYICLSPIFLHFLHIYLFLQNFTVRVLELDTHGHGPSDTNTNHIHQFFSLHYKSSKNYIFYTKCYLKT
jgi:hypothetical protein